MIIKKHKSTKNEYLFSKVWVRNLTKSDAIPYDINTYFSEEDRKIISLNETFNSFLGVSRISEISTKWENVIIISDGFGFEEKQQLLDKLPKNVAIIATNKSLINYDRKRPINLYVTNNPYQECMYSMPKKYFPAIAMSYKTNYEFAKYYKGQKYFYEATPDILTAKRKDAHLIDDYRNSICAAISLAFFFSAKKIMLFCCDKSFSKNQTTSIKLPNGLFTYEQNIVADEIIDGHLYWLKEKGLKIANYSSGKEYINSKYILNEEDMLTFFHNDDGVLK